MCQPTANPPITVAIVQDPIALRFQCIAPYRAFHQRCPTHQLYFPPNVENEGPQSGETGMGQEIAGNSRGFCRIFTENPSPGNSGWGRHFEDLGGGISGQMRMAKADMLGKGELYNGALMNYTINSPRIF